MIRHWKHLALATVIQLGLGATFASAQAPQSLSGQYQRNGHPALVAQYGNRTPYIAGVYTIAGRTAEVRQHGGHLWFINEWGSVSAGRFLSPNTVVAYDWDHGLTGVLTRNGIEWANGTVWWSGR